jgi:hypothetical protein
MFLSCHRNQTHEHCFVLAFDARTTSARELLQQVRAERFKKANPKLEILTTVTGSAAPPKAVFKFVDDTEVGSKSCGGLEIVRR